MARRFDGDDGASGGAFDEGSVADVLWRILAGGDSAGPVWGEDGPWDPDVPSPARMYDVFLGGKDNGEVDRVAAGRVAAAAPSVPRAARDNRAFMHRVVAWAARHGIGQFVDVGTGIPTEPNPHQIAREHRPDAVVVGVDNDPLVLAHDRALLEGMPIVRGDVREVDALIADLDAWIDWDRPVAVLLIAVLHFVADDYDPAGIVRAFTGRMVPGSVVALSHGCSTGADPAALAQVEKVYQGASAPGVARTREQIAGLFGRRLELVPPGVVPVQHWPHEVGPLTAIPVLGGVGVVPDPRAGRVPGRVGRVVPRWRDPLRTVPGRDAPGSDGTGVTGECAR
ncbi:SAM-dependent methyltransferase [Actinomadura formosensis]|uniref:SAM-dependent methyltransferase n=1 Tax=Actinomadura formosensis TaxID=60706 RepID=UPI003D8CF977